MPDISALVRDHGYWVLGLVVVLENAGLPVPGETALLAAGYLTSPEGGHHLRLWLVVLVAFLAAVTGDNIGFWVGRRLARPRLAAGKPFLFLTPQRMGVAGRYFGKYGSLTVFFSRFITGLRVVAGPAAGASGMKWYRFPIANAAGALCWTVAISLVGHFAGHAWGAARDRLGSGAWVVLAVVVTALAGWRLREYIRRKKSDRPTEGTSGSTRVNGS